MNPPSEKKKSYNVKRASRPPLLDHTPTCRDPWCDERENGREMRKMSAAETSHIPWASSWGEKKTAKKLSLFSHVIPRLSNPPTTARVLLQYVTPPTGSRAIKRRLASNPLCNTRSNAVQTSGHNVEGPRPLERTNPQPNARFSATALSQSTSTATHDSVGLLGWLFTHTHRFLVFFLSYYLL